MLRTVLGCHSYARIDGPPPAAGTRVKVVFAQPQQLVIRFAEGDTAVRTGVGNVTGTFRRMDADGIHLSGLKPVYGVLVAGRERHESDFAAAITVVPATGIEIRAEKFDLVRTGIVAVLTIAALLTLLVAAAFGNASSEGGSY